MSRGSSLLTLRKLRERQRDQAHAALGTAHRVLAAFEQKRKAWRASAGAECAATPDALTATAWLEGARRREWQGEAEAQRLRQTVDEAERHYRAADLALEQIVQLQKRQAERSRQDEARRLQSRIDDMQRTDVEGWG